MNKIFLIAVVFSHLVFGTDLREIKVVVEGCVTEDVEDFRLCTMAGLQNRGIEATVQTIPNEQMECPQLDSAPTDSEVPTFTEGKVFGERCHDLIRDNAGIYLLISCFLMITGPWLIGLHVRDYQVLTAMQVAVGILVAVGSGFTIIFHEDEDLIDDLKREN